MATPYQRPPSLLDSPNLGFGTGFTSTGDMRRKVGGNNLSLHPRRVAQRKAQYEAEDRAIRDEDRGIYQKDRAEGRDMQRRELALMYARMGLAPDGSPLVPGMAPTMGRAPGTGGSSAYPISPLTPGGLPPVAMPNVGFDSEWNGSLNPDGTVGFAQPTAPVAPMMSIPPMGGAIAPPGASAPVAPPMGNPYLGMFSPGSAPIPSSVTTAPPAMRAELQFNDMGLRQNAMAAQNLASGQAAVAALQATQAQQNVDPWTRGQTAGGNILSATPGAVISRAPSGNATMDSIYGNGSATYGAPPPKSFTTTGADGRSYTAPTLDKWKQDQIGERALGRAAGFDADLAAGAAGARQAQGRNSFLDTLEQIHQSATKRKA